MASRDDIVKRTEQLGRETLNRCIKKQSVNHQLQPEYLHWLLPLLQTQVNLFAAITVLLEVDRLNEAAPLVRILMESYTNLHFVLNHKSPDKIWELYYSEFVLDTETEAQITADINDKTFGEVCDADPHYKLWNDAKSDPRVMKLIEAKQANKKLTDKIGTMMDVVRQIAAGVGSLTNEEIETARFLAKRQLANSALKRLEWRSVSAWEKEKALVRTWINPADTQGETAAKQSAAQVQFGAMRSKYNAHVHCSGTLLATMLTRHPTEDAHIEIGPSENENQNLMTWRLAGEFASGSIHKMVSHFDLGSELLDDITAVHAGFKPYVD